MASAEREAITGVWGRSPQRGPGAEPLVRKSGGQAPLKLEAFYLSQVQMGRKFAYFCYLVNCSSMLFGRPFVKRFVLCYWTVACLSVLSLTLVYCSQTVGWINMSLGMEVGLRPGHIVLHGDLAPPKGHNSPQFSTHVYCGQTAGWIKMPRFTEVGLGPRHIVLDGDPAPPTDRGTAAPPPQLFSACLSLLCSGRGFYAVVKYTELNHCVLVARTQAGLSIVVKRSPISATAEHLLKEYCCVKC